MHSEVLKLPLWITQNISFGILVRILIVIQSLNLTFFVKSHNFILWSFHWRGSPLSSFDAFLPSNGVLLRLFSGHIKLLVTSCQIRLLTHILHMPPLSGRSTKLKTVLGQFRGEPSSPFLLVLTRMNLYFWGQRKPLASFKHTFRLKNVFEMQFYRQRKNICFSAKFSAFPGISIWMRDESPRRETRKFLTSF